MKTSLLKPKKSVKNQSISTSGTAITDNRTSSQQISQLHKNISKSTKLQQQTSVQRAADNSNHAPIASFDDTKQPEYSKELAEPISLEPANLQKSHNDIT